jgi:hypothetical protein
LAYIPVSRPRDTSGEPYSGVPKHVTGTLLVNQGPTYLGAIIINAPGTNWVLTVYDGIDATGTVIGTISPSASGGNFVYDCALANGLYIASSGTAGSATVVYSAQ